MEAKVLVRFKGIKENRIFEAGEVFTGTKARIAELQKKGFVEAKKEAKGGAA